MRRGGGMNLKFRHFWKLVSNAYEESFLAYGVYEDLQWFKDALSFVRDVLLDAEQKKDQNHELGEWLRQIQNICYEVEDILDRFELQDKRKQVVKSSGSTRLKVRRLISYSNNRFVFRVKMTREIKEIRDRLNKLAADGSCFGLARVSVGPESVVQRREMTYSYVDVLDVIGRENDKEEIMKLLMQPYPQGDGVGDKSLCVIPIVGIGGLGKTTLAKLVFNDERVDQLFQLKMWVCVSYNFDIKQILIKIIHSTSYSTPTTAFTLQENIYNLDIEQLLSCLQYQLFGQKYLLVLDDVWNDDRAKWLQLKDLLKGGAIGSKIIVTTRSKSIASMMGDVSSYVLNGLSQEDCLSLFVKWVFKEGEEEKYPNLVEIGKEIVKKCQGVPLAVRSLGSSLFLKFDVSEWEIIRDSEIWKLEHMRYDILPALKLSYDHMPSYLRRCFAYFSLYPKDHFFRVNNITNLWVALGLVESKNGSENLENIAREYIDEFHSRSFLLDLVDDGQFLRFKVHDLVHNLALYIAKEECVLVKSHTQNIPKQVRHMSIVENDSLDHDLFSKSKQVRTILFPILGVGLDSASLLDTWISRYKCLRLLDLSDSSIDTIPDSIAKLEHLRTLDLFNNRKIKRLPDSICATETLETLVIEKLSNLKMLPECLTTMTHLKKLRIRLCPQLLTLPNDIHRLTALEDLHIHHCPELCQKYQPEIGEYWSMIAHIKHVSIGMQK
ncbi:hypothetical protein TSUD_332530 [Trifolium subterraneum]|uniref:NB-ARC domain-containing protein n=1 Tax=Trifolium subterraneum TaxID=3900 RepID=A0A2Z6MBQ7_TRISU|nr:hypothetical protein TSUD_332530 [Trifolium subterraneum]